MLGVLRAISVSLVILTQLMPADASADDGPAYELSLEVDLPLVLISGALASSFFLRSEVGPAHCAPLCDPSNLNPLDRKFAGYYDQKWGTVGDISTASVLLFGPVMLMIGEGPLDGLNDSLVVAESALAASAVQVLVSYAVKRPRPRVYGEKAPFDSRDDANAARSFFSGHVGNGVAATLATSLAFFRIDEPIWGWATLAAGLGGSALIGVARIAAGSHFPTDVLVGAAVGAALGIAIPALHGWGVSVSPVVDAENESAVLAVGYRL